MNNKLSFQRGAVQHLRQPILAATFDCGDVASLQCWLRSQPHRLDNGQIELDK